MAKMHRPLPTRELNLYDCMFDGLGDNRPWMPAVPEYLAGGGMRMFGNANIGNLELTNLTIPGQLADRATAIICNWYARTNIPPCTELDDWANTAQVHLVVGSMPQAQLSVHDLLRRNTGFVLPYGCDAIGSPQSWPATLDAATRRAHAAYQEKTGMRFGLSDLGGIERDAWRNVAKVMLETFKFPPVITVPIRQNFHVHVGGSATFQALCKHVRDYGEGDDAIQPRARLWIHLEGMSFYDE